MAEETSATVGATPVPYFWIDEEANRGGFLIMALGTAFFAGILGVLPFIFGLHSGVQFLYRGFTFTAGPGWWSVSAAVYTVLAGAIISAGATIEYRLRGQIVRVGVSDSGVTFCSRRVQRFISWSKFLPGPFKMDRGRGFVIQAMKPASSWRTVTFVVGPRSGKAVIEDARFPPPR
jgi:hypothetical protein